jgi:hypothetical protein
MNDLVIRLFLNFTLPQASLTCDFYDARHIINFMSIFFRMLTIADAAGHYSGSDDYEYDWHLGFPPSKTLKQSHKKKLPKPSQQQSAQSSESGVLPTVPVDPLAMDTNDDDKAAAAKAERKLLKKAEKERRKKEKKERKKNRLSSSNDTGSVIVEGTTLKASPIRLKIKTLVPPLGSNAAMLSYSDSLTSASKIEDGIKSNGHTSSNDAGEDSDVMSTTSSAATKNRRSSVSSGGKRLSTSNRDVRTQCDKCDGPGSNGNLVRCDECRRCYHFSCLIPPVKKSPKVAGYSWHCVDCDPSDRDSDWHLD